MVNESFLAVEEVCPNGTPTPYLKQKLPKNEGLCVVKLSQALQMQLQNNGLNIFSHYNYESLSPKITLARFNPRS